MDVAIHTLPSRRCLALRYTGDAAGLSRHWQRFHEMRSRIASSEPDVLAIAYAPPVAYGAPAVVDLCLPVSDEVPALVEGAEIRVVPGGRFVLARGRPDALPDLYRAARRHANELGVAVERGGIEIYRESGDEVAVDAGYRVHD